MAHKIKFKIIKVMEQVLLLIFNCASLLAKQKVSLKNKRRLLKNKESEHFQTVNYLLLSNFLWMFHKHSEHTRYTKKTPNMLKIKVLLGKLQLIRKFYSRFMVLFYLDIAIYYIMVLNIHIHSCTLLIP